MTVSGAYGRDYKSGKEIKADWKAGKDFQIRSMDGSGYISIREAAGIEVWGRYKQDREIVLLQR